MAPFKKNFRHISSVLIFFQIAKMMKSRPFISALLRCLNLCTTSLQFGCLPTNYVYKRALCCNSVYGSKFNIYRCWTSAMLTRVFSGVYYLTQFFWTFFNFSDDLLNVPLLIGNIFCFVPPVYERERARCKRL